MRIRHTDLSTSGYTILSSQFTFGGETFLANTRVATDFELQNTDFTLYYRLLDNGVISFDLGLTGKYLDADISVSDDMTGYGRDSFRGFIPLVYAALEFGILPGTGLSLIAEGPAVDLSLRAGYREFTLELDDMDGVFADWSLKGPFLGLKARF